jgi:hypothetical protein
VTTIDYDKPVADFIEGLDATGHVTHIAYKKKSVTFHHNGGRLSLAGILEVWKTRLASAHFQVDKNGALGQYVRVQEYAWAVGNLEGNKESISIEMANATLRPDWEVAMVTWTNACRLAGWLFANVIDGRPRPTSSNVYVHKHWKSTDCAGPFIDSIFDDMLRETQRWYDYFMGDAPNLTIATKAVVTAYAGRPMRVSDSFYKDARQVLAWGRSLPKQPVRPEWEKQWVSEMANFKFSDASKTYTHCLMQLMDYFGIDQDLHNVLGLLKRMKDYGYSIISYEGKAI